jgi:hypothetical protein
LKSLYFSVKFKKQKIMKRMVIAVAAIATLALVSCKKDWDCTCTSSVAGSTASTTTHKELKKGQAKAACHDWEYTYTDASGAKTTVTETCTLAKK